MLYVEPMEDETSVEGGLHMDPPPSGAMPEPPIQTQIATKGKKASKGSKKKKAKPPKSAGEKGKAGSKGSAKAAAAPPGPPASSALLADGALAAGLRAYSPHLDPHAVPGQVHPLN